MPLINAEELGADLEDRPVAEGKYDLRILKADYGENRDKTGHRLALMIRVEGAEGEGATPINHYLSDPTDDVEPSKKRQRMRDIKRFCAVFGIDTSGGIDLENTDTFVGATGNCLVTLENDEQYGDQNRLRLPKVA